MNQYDPFEWTLDFVRTEPAFCKEQLIIGCSLCVQYLQEKNYYIAGYSLNGIINGIDLLQKSTGLDLSYYFSQFTLAAGIVYMLDGSQAEQEAEQEQLRKMAISYFETALRLKNINDSALENMIIGTVSKLRSGVSLAAILHEMGEDVASVLIHKVEYLTKELMCEWE